MRILIFGSTGMVGQGVLRQALADDRVSHVVSVVRRPTDQRDPKLEEILLEDFATIDTLRDHLVGFDATLFCAGVTAAGLTEAEYASLTYDLTLTVATLLATLNPGMTFLYVSGAGTDSSESGRFMWARVKGRTENALRRLPFKEAYMFRPGAIQPLHGIRSKTRWYNAIYDATRRLYPLLVRFFPGFVTTTDQLGRAMIGVAADGYAKPVLETSDINSVP